MVVEEVEVVVLVLEIYGDWFRYDGFLLLVVVGERSWSWRSRMVMVEEVMVVMLVRMVIIELGLGIIRFYSSHCAFMFASSSVSGTRHRQNGHCIYAARMLPAHESYWHDCNWSRGTMSISLQNVYVCILDFFSSSDRCIEQMGQSPRCVLSCCLNRTSSHISSARFVHAGVCFGLCSSCSWQATLQFEQGCKRKRCITFLHLQFDAIDFPEMPQEA